MRMIPDEARIELGNAQFILGDGYTDWVWQERVKNSVSPFSESAPSSKAWPYKSAKDAENVVQMPKRKR